MATIASQGRGFRLLGKRDADEASLIAGTVFGVGH
jgi:hypothetical protein